MSVLVTALLGALVWDAVSFVPALAVWPFFRRFFPKSIAWGTARLSAAAIVAYVTLWPAVILGTTPFSGPALLVSLVVCAAFAWGLCSSDRKLKGLNLAFELFYLGILCLAALYMTRIPSVASLGERMRDTAIWNAIWVQRRFPIQDPWLSGWPIRYYVFGYLPHAAVGFFTPLRPLPAYNLALAATAAQYLSALFLVFRAAELSAMGSALGAALVGLGSNLKSLLQALGTLFSGTSYNWWDPSRAIKNTINEFPLWTATLGDLHPHFLCLYLFALIAAITWVSASERKDGSLRAPFIVAGLLVAWLWGGNTWEVPIACGLVCLLLAAVPGGRKEKARRLFLFALSVAAFACPFLLVGSKASRSFGLVHSRSTARELWLAFGLFFLPIAGYPFLRWIKERAKRDVLGGLALLFVVSFALSSGLFFLIALMTLLAVSWLWEGRGARDRVYGLALFGLSILVFCELFHLNDVYGDDLERLNTVFKFYMPAWSALGIAAVLFGREGRDLLPPRAFRGLVGVWTLALSAHLLFGIPARTDGFRATGSADGLGEIERASRDDADLIRWMQPRAESGELKGVLLEAVGGGYSLYTRFASTTGLPGYLGWEGYGYWNIYDLTGPFAERRKRVSELTGETPRSVAAEAECPDLMASLKEAGIDFVAMGSLERKSFAPEAVARFERCLVTVHAEGHSMLLAVKER